MEHSHRILCQVGLCLLLDSRFAGFELRCRYPMILRLWTWAWRRPTNILWHIPRPNLTWLVHIGAMRLFLEFGIEFMDAMHETEWNWRKLTKLRVLTRLHDFNTVVFWGISWEGELCGLDDAVKADLGNAKRTGHTMNLQVMRMLAAWVVSKASLERNH